MLRPLNIRRRNTLGTGTLSGTSMRVRRAPGLAALLLLVLSLGTVGVHIPLSLWALWILACCPARRRLMCRGLWCMVCMEDGSLLLLDL